MKPVLISELKNRLSFYLKAVRGGQTVLVAHRDQIVARIEPVGPATAGAAGDDAAWIAQLEQHGTIRRARGQLAADWAKRRPRTRADIVGALLSERDEGR